MNIKNITCKVCSKLTTPIFKHCILGKYNVTYFKCSYCEYLQTEKPYWIDEAYSKAIAESDTGCLSRNIYFAKQVRYVVCLLFDKDIKMLDYGGGYGLFTRLMRDYGINCYHYDQYCDNIFNNYFETKENEKFNVVTAFEVMEHIYEPMHLLNEIFNKYNVDSFLFSTLLLPESVPNTEWWYYGFEHGQHVGFYSKKTLKTMADIMHLSFYQISNDLFIFSKNKVSLSRKLINSNKYLKSLYRRYSFRNFKSLTKPDSEYIKSLHEKKNNNI